MPALFLVHYLVATAGLWGLGRVKIVRSLGCGRRSVRGVHRMFPITPPPCG
jgi:hypothetical protein